MPEHTVRKPSGYVVITPEFGPAIEYDSRQCVHCQAHWIVQPGSGTMRGWCHNCAGFTCGGQGCDRCLPAEKWLDEVERAHARMLNRASL